MVVTFTDESIAVLCSGCIHTAVTSAGECMKASLLYRTSLLKYCPRGAVDMAIHCVWLSAADILYPVISSVLTGFKKFQYFNYG